MEWYFDTMQLWTKLLGECFHDFITENRGMRAYFEKDLKALSFSSYKQVSCTIHNLNTITSKHAAILTFHVSFQTSTEEAVSN